MPLPGSARLARASSRPPASSPPHAASRHIAPAPLKVGVLFGYQQDQLSAREPATKRASHPESARHRVSAPRGHHRSVRCTPGQLRRQMHVRRGPRKILCKSRGKLRQTARRSGMLISRGPHQGRTQTDSNSAGENIQRQSGFPGKSPCRAANNLMEGLMLRSAGCRCRSGFVLRPFFGYRVTAGTCLLRFWSRRGI